jgi:hypothetical protein
VQAVGAWHGRRLGDRRAVVLPANMRLRPVVYLSLKSSPGPGGRASMAGPLAISAEAREAFMRAEHVVQNVVRAGRQRCSVVLSARRFIAEPQVPVTGASEALA